MTLCLNQRLLVLIKYLIQCFGLQFSSLDMLVQKCFNDPELIIPAVKIPLVLLQHFVAKKQLILENFRVHLEVRHQLLKLDSLENSPLPMEPKRVALRTLHDSFDQELQLVSDHHELLLQICLVKQVDQNFPAVVPESGEVGR